MDVPEQSASDLALVLSAHAESRPRPIKKLFGTNGPSPEQLAAYKEYARKWSAEDRRLRKLHKIALDRDNANFWAGRRIIAP